MMRHVLVQLEAVFCLFTWALYYQLDSDARMCPFRVSLASESASCYHPLLGRIDRHHVSAGLVMIGTTIGCVPGV